MVFWWVLELLIIRTLHLHWLGHAFHLLYLTIQFIGFRQGLGLLFLNDKLIVHYTPPFSGIYLANPHSLHSHLCRHKEHLRRHQHIGLLISPEQQTHPLRLIAIINDLNFPEIIRTQIHSFNIHFFDQLWLLLRFD